MEKSLCDELVAGGGCVGDLFGARERRPFSSFEVCGVACLAWGGWVAELKPFFGKAKIVDLAHALVLWLDFEGNWDACTRLELKIGPCSDVSALRFSIP